jgi:Trk-type K+ transport system membrane component
MGIFLILLVAVIVGIIGLGVGFFVFVILQRRRKIYEEERRKGEKIETTSPILGAFIAMVCTIFVNCVILVITYFVFAVWVLKDFTLF